MVSCCKLLGVRSFVLEVRSLSGNNVPVNLYQTMLFSVLTRKGKVPRHNFHPSKVSVLAKKWQISAGGSLRGPPDPVQLSSLRKPSDQTNWPIGSSGHPSKAGGATRSHRLTQAD